MVLQTTCHKNQNNIQNYYYFLCKTKLASPFKTLLTGLQLKEKFDMLREARQTRMRLRLQKRTQEEIISFAFPVHFMEEPI